MTFLKTLARIFRTLALGFFLLIVLFQALPRPELLFYRGVGLSFLAGLMIVFFEGRFSWDSLKNEPLLSRAVMSICFNITFLILFPVTFERSVSMFFLREWEIAASEGLTEKEAEERLIRGYVIQLQATNRRISEQVQSGNLWKEGDRYYLSEQGKRFLSFSRKVLPFFSSDSRVLDHENER